MPVTLRALNPPPAPGTNQLTDRDKSKGPPLETEHSIIAIGVGMRRRGVLASYDREAPLPFCFSFQDPPPGAGGCWVNNKAYILTPHFRRIFIRTSCVDLTQLQSQSSSVSWRVLRFPIVNSDPQLASCVPYRGGGPRYHSSGASRRVRMHEYVEPT